MAADPSWTTDAAPMIQCIEKQDNLTMRLFPWSTVQSEGAPGGRIKSLYLFVVL